MFFKRRAPCEGCEKFASTLGLILDGIENISEQIAALPDTAATLDAAASIFGQAVKVKSIDIDTVQRKTLQAVDAALQLKAFETGQLPQTTMTPAQVEAYIEKDTGPQESVEVQNWVED